jgi:DNA-binding transcriptional MerR regulator
MAKYLTIGNVAKRVGLNPKTIRYYEEIGLLPGFERSRSRPTGNGYRLFTEQDIHRLEFVKRARELDLSLAQVKELLRATERGSGSSELVAFVDAKLGDIERRLHDLESLRRALTQLRDRTKVKARKTTASCCEPVCSPITCGPEGQTAALVQVGKSTRSERR